jgi:hypothetical protein
MVLGDHRDTAQTISTLAVILRGQGRLAEAEPMFRQCLEMRKKVLSPGDEQVLNSVRNLAEVLRWQGKSAEADGLLETQNLFHYE